MVNLWKDNYQDLWRRELRGWGIDSATSLEVLGRSVSLSSNKDSLAWIGNNNTWSTHDCYKLINQHRNLSGPWKWIWQV